MNYKFFLFGIKNILLNPLKAWETIYSENNSVKFIRLNFLFPLIILVSISAVIGSMIFTNAELSPVYSILIGIKTFCLLFFAIYASTFILGEITFPLDLGKSFNVSFKLIVYSIIPYLVCQIMSRIFESLLFVDIMGLYGLYIFWVGTEKMLTPPHYKKMPLLISTTVILIGMFITINMVLTKLIDKIFYAFFS